MLHLTGLNHSIVATRDLESARQTFSDLGFTLTPRGVHPGRGTANYCIMFANANYIELLGRRHDGSEVEEPLLMEELKFGEGIAAVAFDSDNGEALWQELAATGITPTRPKIAQRDFDDDGRTETVRFEILKLPRDATPRLRSFICRHLDPAIVYHAKFRDHDNTAQTIKALTLRVDDPDAVRPAYETLLGPPRATNGHLSFETGNSRLHLAPRSWIEQNLWTRATVDGCPDSVMTIGCRDPGHAARLAETRGFSVDTTARRQTVVEPRRTCGLGLVYEAADR